MKEKKCYKTIVLCNEYEKNKFKLKVKIFKKKKDMLEYYQKKINIDGMIAEAAFLPYYWIYYNKKGKAKIDKIIGEIIFYKKYLGTGILTHECIHAALEYCRRLGNIYTSFGKGIDEKREEILCDTTASMMIQIVNFIYDNKLIKKK